MSGQHSFKGSHACLLSVLDHVISRMESEISFANSVTMFCCRIQYTSGEIEELDLEEIIREGHMSLITQ